MSRRLILALLLLLALPAGAAEPLLRLESNATQGLHKGQRLELQLQLLVPTYFLAAPQFPALQLDERNQATPEASRNLSPRIDGRSWAGIERTYHFAPLPPGTYQLQTSEITVRYADEQREPREVTLQVPALRFTVSTNQGQAGTPLAPQLRLSERYAPARAELQVGDILLRRLRLELDDAGNLLPPEVPLAAVPGTRLYRNPPRLNQDMERIAQRFVREEEVRYLLLESGELEIPALTVEWRDTRSGQLQQVSLPARRLQVAGVTATPVHQVSGWQHLALLTAAALLLGNALAGSIYGHRWWRRRVLNQQLRSGKPTAVLQALQHWLESYPEAQQATLRSQLAEPLRALQAACYGTAGDWHSEPLRRALRGLSRQPAAGAQAQPDWRLNP